MPCLNPSQAYFSVREDGKKELKFSNVLGRMFRQGCKMPDDSMSVACGQCMFCRLEKSRETALRCVHESRMFSDNCFITLTFSDEKMKELCPLTPGGYSLVRKHAQDFMKRLREKFARGFEYVLRDGKKRFYQSKNVRAYGCGEYGDNNGRPHYHMCLFGHGFYDGRKPAGKSGSGAVFFDSELLSRLWGHGIVSVQDLTNETASYCARYIMKKQMGDSAKEYYGDRVPEYNAMSLKPGIGAAWFDQFRRDVFPHDFVIQRGVKRRPPKFYDRILKRSKAAILDDIEYRREQKGKLSAADNTDERRAVREVVHLARVSTLSRSSFDE